MKAAAIRVTLKDTIVEISHMALFMILVTAGIISPTLVIVMTHLQK